MYGRGVRLGRLVAAKPGAGPVSPEDAMALTDDEETDADVFAFRQRREKLAADSAAAFDDVVLDFCEIKNITAKFEDWKFRFPRSYRNAFASDSLRKVLLPLVRLELLMWNPLDPDCADFMEMAWFDQLAT